MLRAWAAPSPVVPPREVEAAGIEPAQDFNRPIRKSGDRAIAHVSGRLITPPAARRLGSVVSGDAHLCACVFRGEPRDQVQCDAPRLCGIPSKWNIERQPMASGPPAALTSIGSRECDESLHLARGPNFEFHARSIGRTSETAEAARGTFVNTGPAERRLVCA
jgi:hypothetical protein